MSDIEGDKQKNDDEDDTPPESLFFMRRAEFVPKVSAEEFKTVSELLDKNDSNNILVGKVAIKNGSSGAVKKSKSNNGTAKKSSVETEGILDENSLSNHQVVLSAATKRRLKKQQEELASELRLIKAANRQVIAAVEEPSITEVEEIVVDKSEVNTSTILTISYMSETARLRCYENEKFAAIFPRVAEMFKLKASELLLCLGEQNIKIDDTPKSLNITLADTIDCIPRKADESGEMHMGDEIKLYFQSSDSKEKIDFLVHKLQKLKEIMDKYSKLRNIPLEQLIFEFDGERIQGTETPEDLDMESGNCIDVRIIKLTPIEEIAIETPTKKTTRGTSPRRSTRNTARETTTRNTTGQTPTRNTTRRTPTRNTTRRTTRRTPERATKRKATRGRQRGTRRSPRKKDTVIVLDDDSNSSIVLDDVSNSSIILDDDDSNNSSILMCD